VNSSELEILLKTMKTFILREEIENIKIYVHFEKSSGELE